MTADVLPAAAPSRFATLRLSLRRLVDRHPAARYGAAAAMVAVCLGVRLLLSPAFANGYGYTCFYPAVVLSAYLLGAKPGAFATLLSAGLVYAFLGLQPLALSTDGAGYVILGFFLVSSTIAIYVLSEIRGQLRHLSRSHEAAEAMVQSQAELFREHAERVTNHLQLIAAILQLQARGEADHAVSRVLTNAASRTLLISRMHREFAGGGDRSIDFQAFAHRLVAAAAATGSPGSRRVRISGDRLAVPLEHATGLGLVLLECLHAGDQPPGAAAPELEVDLRELAGGERRLTVARPGAAGVRDILMLEAIAEQLGGRLLLTRTDAGGEVSLTFPASLQPPPAWEPLAKALH